MFSFEKGYKKTGLAHELEYINKNKVADYKQRTKEIIEEIEAFIIVEYGVTRPNYKEYDFKTILVLDVEEYKKLISFRTIKDLIFSKTVIDLSR